MPGGRILVVDDDQTILTSLGRILRHEGYQVSGYASATDALTRVVAEPPDIILLDLMLPGMTGRQFLDTLHNRLGLRDIPVVIMTGMRGIDHKLAVSMGASDMIEKPFDTDELLNKIALALFRARGAATAGAHPVAPGRDKPAHAPAEKLADELVLVVSDDQARLGRLEPLITTRGPRLVVLIRVTDELPRLARALAPRVIVLDLRVPGIGALTALRRLRADSALDSVPIVMFCDDQRAADRVLPELNARGAAILVQPPGKDDEALIAHMTAPPATAWPGASVV